MEKAYRLALDRSAQVGSAKTTVNPPHRNDEWNSTRLSAYLPPPTHRTMREMPNFRLSFALPADFDDVETPRRLLFQRAKIGFGSATQELGLGPGNTLRAAHSRRCLTRTHFDKNELPIREIADEVNFPTTASPVALQDAKSGFPSQPLLRKGLPPPPFKEM